MSARLLCRWFVNKKKVFVNKKKVWSRQFISTWALVKP